MAAVLLRRLLSSAFDEVYPTLPSDVQTAIKSELLMIIQMETQSSMRKKVCDIAAELARNLIGVCTVGGRCVCCLCLFVCFLRQDLD